MGGVQLTHLWWADNLWLIGTPCKLPVMIRQATEALQGVLGLDWKPSSLQVLWARTAPLEHRVAMTATSMQGECMECKRVDGLDVLGDVLDEMGSSQESLVHRERTAERL